MCCFCFSYPSCFICLSPLLWLDALPVCLCCHFLSSAGVWATESKGDHSGSAHQLDSGSRCGVLFTFSEAEAFLLQPSLFLGFLCEFLWMISAKHLSRLILLLTYSESEIPSQERKNYKSSPEIQVGKPEMFKTVQKVGEGFDTFLWGTLMLKLLHVPFRSPYAHWKKEP